MLDTSVLPASVLRRLIEQRFTTASSAESGLAVTLMSFAYPFGLPPDADLVFDARFLRNPHYEPTLRDRTGLDHEVAAYVEADPDFAPFVEKVTDLLTLLLPRFMEEGKKYATIAVGCTGGKHRSVHTVQLLAERRRLSVPVPVATEGRAGYWRVAVTHRELMRAQTAGERSARPAAAIQAQEA